MANKETDKTWGKIHPKEPVFVLRGRDVLAAVAVDAWADLAEGTGVCSVEKIDAARRVAQQMRRYGNRRLPD